MPTEKVYDLEVLQDGHLTCLAWVPRGSRVLEFGPATGYLSRAMRNELGCSVTGVESSPQAAREAAENCDRMIVGDIEDPDIWQQLAPPYTVAIFLDVLEHLREPWHALTRSREVLSPDGLLIISVPNIAHWSIRRDLLRGRFEYESRGILDDTHLRFFTKKTLLAMISECGFEPLEVRPTHSQYPGDRFCERIGMTWLKRPFNALADRLFPEATAYQYLVRCSPEPAGQTPAAAPDMLEKAGA